MLLFNCVPRVNTTSNLENERSPMVPGQLNMVDESSCADFTILQFLYFGRPRDVLSVLLSLNLPCQVYVSALEIFL